MGRHPQSGGHSATDVLIGILPLIHEAIGRLIVKLLFKGRYCTGERNERPRVTFASIPRIHRRVEPWSHAYGRHVTGEIVNLGEPIKREA